MPRMGLGLGLGLVPKILGDGSSNPLPELGLIANYQARLNDLSLIPTNKVTGWDDSAGNNTLTQSASSQMPTFDTVNEVVSFDTDDNMVGLPPQSGDFSYVFRGIEFLGDISSQNRFLSQQALSTKAYAQNNSIIIQSDQNNFWNIASGQFDLSSQFDLVITLSGSTLSGYQNGELKGSRDIGSDTITLDKIGNINNQSINGTLKEVGVYDRALTLEEIEKI